MTVGVIASAIGTTPVQSAGIICKSGYRESVSFTRPFCVSRYESTYKDVPMNLLLDSYDNLRYGDLVCRGKDFLETRVSEQLLYSQNALGQDLGKVSLGEVWPATKGVIRNWNQVAKLLCNGAACTTNTSIQIGWEWLKRYIGWYVAFLPTQMSLINIEEGYGQPINISLLPTEWFSHQKLGTLINAFDIWDKPLKDSGYLYPTVGQLGETIYQMEMVAQATTTNTGFGLEKVYSVPSDSKRPHERVGKGEIITGSNRVVKQFCDSPITNTGQRQHNECAYIITRIPSQGNNYYILVNGEFDKVRKNQGGGGDKTVATTQVIQQGNQRPVDLHRGDFTGDEVVGSTNDVPNLPSGQSKNVDGCLYGQIYLRPYVRYMRDQVPTYGKLPCIWNRSVDAKYYKYVILFDSVDSDNVYLAAVERPCYLRQTYKAVPCGLNKMACGDVSSVIKACGPVTNASNAKRVAKIDYSKVFPWTIRAGIPIMKVQGVK